MERETRRQTNGTGSYHNRDASIRPRAFGAVQTIHCAGAYKGEQARIPFNLIGGVHDGWREGTDLSKTREEIRRRRRIAWECAAFFGCIALACGIPGFLEVAL